MIVDESESDGESENGSGEYLSHQNNPRDKKIKTLEDVDLNFNVSNLVELMPFKNATCKFFGIPGSCRNGNRCRFFHGYPDHRRNWVNYPEKLKIKDQKMTERIKIQKECIEKEVELYRDSVMEDMKYWEKAKIWPFSAYGPEDEKSIDNFCDKSFEEIRWELMEAKSGRQPKLNELATPESLTNRYVRMAKWRRVVAASKLEASKLIMTCLGYSPIEDEYDPELGNVCFSDIEEKSQQELFQELNSLTLGVLDIPHNLAKTVPPKNPFKKTLVASMKTVKTWSAWKPRGKNPYVWIRPDLVKRPNVWIRPGYDPKKPQAIGKSCAEKTKDATL